jgi:1-acyl-sn-glycerol-3-phosphate acyltransferase
MKQIRASIRLILFFAATFSCYGAWFAGSFFIPNKLYWRQIVFRTWARSLVRIMNVKIDVIGKTPEPPFFLVSNHLSYTDIPVLRSVIEAVFVAKGEIQTWLLGRRLVGDLGNIFVNRQNRRDIPRAGAEVLEALARGEGVIIFPEGTSSKGEDVLPFKSSFLEFAAQSDLPVYYASITYGTPVNEIPASTAVCWWDDSTLIAHMWRLFGVKEFRAIVTFGEMPVQNADRKKLARELWEKVSAQFIPVI